MLGLFERNINTETLCTAQAANGVFTYPRSCAAQSNIKVNVVGANGASYTIRVRASAGKTAPDFTIADSPTNSWSYVQLRDNVTGNFLSGSTGKVVTTDGTVQLDLNTDIVTFFALEISGYLGGDATCFAIVTNNT